MDTKNPPGAPAASDNGYARKRPTSLERQETLNDYRKRGAYYREYVARIRALPDFAETEGRQWLTAFPMFTRPNDSIVWIRAYYTEAELPRRAPTWTGVTPPVVPALRPFPPRPPAPPPVAPPLFHAHLDGCAQCADHPFDLCPTGQLLLMTDARATVHDRFCDCPNCGVF